MGHELRAIIYIAAVAAFVLTIIGFFIIAVLEIRSGSKRMVYVDKTWRGWQLESYKFNTDVQNTIFVIFTGLREELNYSDSLDLEAEMEDNGILPMFITSDYRPDSVTIFPLDRNSGNKYKYMGKHTKVKFERISDK